MKKLLLITLCAVLFSCGTYRPLYRTGTYTISWRKGEATRFCGVKGTYVVPSDTLRVGDPVTMVLVTPIKTKKNDR